MENNLPVIIQTIVYRFTKDGPEFLLLKRSEERGGFWNVVNGTMRGDENITQCGQRELLEETGIKHILKRSSELYRFAFEYKNIPITVLVFAVEVDTEQKVVINDEHVEYKWLGFNTALGHLKFNDDKKALRICKESINNI